MGVQTGAMMRPGLAIATVLLLLAILLQNSKGLFRGSKQDSEFLLIETDDEKIQTDDEKIETDDKKIETDDEETEEEAGEDYNDSEESGDKGYGKPRPLDPCEKRAWEGYKCKKYGEICKVEYGKAVCRMSDSRRGSGKGVGNSADGYSRPKEYNKKSYGQTTKKSYGQTTKRNYKPTTKRSYETTTKRSYGPATTTKRSYGVGQDYWASKYGKRRYGGSSSYKMTTVKNYATKKYGDG